MQARRHLRSMILLLVLGLFTFTARAARSARAKDAVRLDNIQALTFQKDKLTTNRRVRPVPQLTCVGGSAKGLFEPETVRCQNSGSSYSTADIEWTCKASMPLEFKLGSTDVVCEGYDSPEDDFILKGSCGLEYRLVLTEAGEQKFGKPNWWGGRSGGHHQASTHATRGSSQNSLISDSTANVLFWLIFGSVVIWMIAKATGNARQAGPRRQPRRNYGGGGGGGHDDGDDDPPPPYSRGPGTYRKSQSQSSDQSWRPGFWTGAAAGAASGYFAGSRRQQQRAYDSGSWFGGGGRSSYDPGESSSRGSSMNFGGGGGSSSRHESTGFGGTRRR